MRSGAIIISEPLFPAKDLKKIPNATKETTNKIATGNLIAPGNYKGNNQRKYRDIMHQESQYFLCKVLVAAESIEGENQHDKDDQDSQYPRKPFQDCHKNISFFESYAFLLLQDIQRLKL